MEILQSELSHQTLYLESGPRNYLLFPRSEYDNDEHLPNHDVSQVWNMGGLISIWLNKFSNKSHYILSLYRRLIACKFSKHPMVIAEILGKFMDNIIENEH